MKKIALIVVAVVSTIATAFSGEITIESRLRNAVEKGNAQEALLWSQCLNNTVSATKAATEIKLIEAQTKWFDNQLLVQKKLGNVWKSVPAILSFSEKMAKATGNINDEDFQIPFNLIQTIYNTIETGKFDGTKLVKIIEKEFKSYR